MSAADAYLAHHGVEVSEEIKHYGVPGMKWGKRKAPDRLEARDTDTAVTKKVKQDYNALDDQEFSRKYATSKKSYAKRVEKHGDPYAKKFSEKDRAIFEARDRQAERSNELQRQAFKTYSANGERAAKAAMNKYEKMEKDILTNPDAETAGKLTSGEKWANAAILTVGGLAIAATIAGKALENRA